MKPLKIAVIVKYFPTLSETFIVNQINTLIDEGYDVSLYAYNKADPHVIHESLYKYELLDKVHYFIKPPASKSVRFYTFLNWIIRHFLKLNWNLLFQTLNVLRYGKDAYTLKLFYEAQWFLLGNEFDLIHAHFGMNGNRIAYLKAKGIIPKTTPLITSLHGYDLEPYKLKVYKKEFAYLFEYVDAFTVNTPYLEGLLKSVDSNLSNYYILPVGLDTSYFVRNNNKTDTTFFDIVFCGRLVAFKGVDIAIAILDTLHNEGFSQTRLFIVGEGKLRKALEMYATQLNIQHAVYFLGALKQDDVKAQFEQSDIFLLPGRYEKETGRAETQGLVIQEAQAMGLPVIIGNVGGMPYGVLPDQTGFVINEGDVSAFVNAVKQLILKPELKHRMGIKGREFVKGDYDNQVLNMQLLKIYMKVLERD